MPTTNHVSCTCGAKRTIGRYVPLGGDQHREEAARVSQSCVRAVVGWGPVSLSCLRAAAEEHGCDIRRARQVQLEQYQLATLPPGHAWAMVSGRRQGHGQYTPVMVALSPGESLEM